MPADEDPDACDQSGQASGIRDSYGVQVGAGSLQINTFHVAAADTRDAMPPRSGSPYRGLKAFEEADSAYFFGRDEAVNEIAGRLSACLDGPGMLAISGVSGAGKSSVLRAGILPRLHRAGLGGDLDASCLPCLFFVPGQHPLDELAMQVASVSGMVASDVRQKLAAGPDAFAPIARQAYLAASRNAAARNAGAQAGRLILMVDQFEQVFSVCEDDNERHGFISALHAAATAVQRPDQAPAALVVLGVRADFETRCFEYDELSDVIQHRYRLKPMTRAELREVIIEPALRAGSSVEESLTAELLTEIGTRRAPQSPGPAAAPGVLPLLSHALDQAWRARAGKTLTLDDYRRTGGIQQAVENSAEAAYRELDPIQQVIAQHVFILLTAASADNSDGSDSAVPREKSYLEDTVGRLAGVRAGDLDAVLSSFARQRLIVLDDRAVEITHEVLLTAWPLLRDTWLAETHADRIVRSRLRGTTAEWEQRSRDSSYLYRGTVLQAAAEAAERAAADPARNPLLDQSERDFLDASQQAHRRSARRRQSAITVLAVLALVAGGLAIWANQQRSAASRQRDQAIENQLVVEAGQLSATNPSLADQLLYTAYSMDRQNQDLAERLISTENQPLSATQPVGRNLASVAFSPDGKTLAAVDFGSFPDDLVRLLNIASPTRQYPVGQPLGKPLTAGKGNAVRAAAFSPDGSTLAIGDEPSGGGNATVSLLNVADPASPRLLGGPLAAGGSIVVAVAFSPDGKTLAAAVDAVRGGGPCCSAVSLWNVADRTRPRPLGRPLAVSQYVDSMTFSPDGKTLAVGDEARNGEGSTGTIRLWNVADTAHPQPLGTPLTAARSITSTAFSRDGQTLAAAFEPAQGGSRMVRLWNVADPARPRPLGGPLAAGKGFAVNAVAFSPVGSTLATGGRTTLSDVGSGGTVRLWDVADPARPQLLGRPFSTGSTEVDSVAFSPDGSALAAGDSGGDVTWLAPPPTTVLASPRRPPPPVDSVAFSRHGGIMATGDDNGAARLWNVADPARPQPLGQPVATGGIVRAVAFSPDGKTLATAAETVNGRTGLRLWNISGPARAQPLGGLLASGEGSGVFAIAFSPDGKTLAADDEIHFARVVRLWNVANPARPQARGRPVTTTSADGTVSSVAFSPDGKTLAVGEHELSGGDTVRLWNITDPARPRALGEPLTIRNGSVSSVAFSPDGRTLAAGGGIQNTGSEVTLWDVADPSRPQALGGPLAVGAGNFVSSVAFSPDSHFLAAGGDAAEVSLWDVTSPAQPQPLGGPATASGSAVNAVAFASDGTMAAAGSGGTLQLWNGNVKYAISRTCRLAAAALGPQQWHQYIPQLPYNPPCPDSR